MLDHLKNLWSRSSSPLIWLLVGATLSMLSHSFGIVHGTEMPRSDSQEVLQDVSKNLLRAHPGARAILAEEDALLWIALPSSDSMPTSHLIITIFQDSEIPDWLVDEEKTNLNLIKY